MFLADGTPTGLIIAEIVNWTGKALVVPRPAFAGFLKREEAQSAGVYILTGPDPDDPFRQLLYVGQSETVGRRLVEHDSDPKKDFFDRAIVFVSKDENLTNAHARFLERHLTGRIKAAGRSTPTNTNNPGGAALPEADVADMEYFLDQIEIVLPVLGLDVLRPVATLRATNPKPGSAMPALDSTNSSPTFELKVGPTLAKAVELDGDFIVKNGSVARDSEAGSLNDGYRSLRMKLKTDGALVQGENQTLIFTRDVAFTSPSAAASVVYGASMSGPANWKLAGTDRTYG
ncbi:MULTISPECIES: GIY-YIG nuclease family protein [unclassified Bradyrhizobium]